MDNQFQKINVQEIPITVCRLNDIENIIENAINEKSPKTLATTNLNHLRLAHENIEFKNILLKFSNCFADGWPVLYLAKKHQQVVLPERVTGSDLTPLICKWASKRNWKIGLVGSSLQVKNKLEQIIPDTFKLNNVKHWIPEYENLEDLYDPQLSAEIKAAEIDILLVALGPFKQEKWIFENLKDSNAMIAMGVGASLAFLSEEISRAPIIFQKLKLEFLHRIITDPKRLIIRYLKDFVYFCKILLK